MPRLRGGLGQGISVNLHPKTGYVAGRFSDWQEVREVQAVLRRHGYEITYDWTVHAEPKDAQAAEWKGTLAPDAQREAAETDLAAARDADLLVLVCEGDMSGALGCFVEFGAAAVAGRRIHVIGAHRGSIFWHLPRVETFCSRSHWAAVFDVRDERPAA